MKEHPGYVAARAYIDAQRGRRALAMISPQVIREFMVVLTRAPVSGRSFTPKEAIVAVMNVHGVSRLATRNAGDFKRYSGVRVDAIAP